MTNFTNTTAMIQETATQLIASDASAMRALATGLVWGWQNPAVTLAVLAGKTPPALKAFKAGLESQGANGDKVRRWVTAYRKATALVMGMTFEAAKIASEDKTESVAFALACADHVSKLGQDMDSALTYAQSRVKALGVDSWHGLNGLYAGMAKPEQPADDSAPETDNQAAPETDDSLVEVQAASLSDTLEGIAATLRAFREHGHMSNVGDVPQGTVLTIVDSLLGVMSPATLAKVAKFVAGEMTDRQNQAELSQVA